MLELFGLAVVIGLCVLFFGAILGLVKITLTILLWPIMALFWVLGGLVRLVLLPFQLIGGLILAILLVPVLLVGLPILLAVGVPLVIAGIVCVGLLIVGGFFCWIGGLIFGWG